MTNKRNYSGVPVMRAALRVTKALADRQRLRILLLLEPGELCVCRIVEVLGLAPSTVSKHLSILAAADLVSSRKEGRWAYYRLSAEAAGSLLAPPALDWLAGALRRDPTIVQDRSRRQAALASASPIPCRRLSGGGQKRKFSSKRGRLK